MTLKTKTAKKSIQVISPLAKTELLLIAAHTVSHESHEALAGTRLTLTQVPLALIANNRKLAG